MKTPLLITWLLLLALPLGVPASHFSFFEPLEPPRAVQMMQHRGAARQAPENTRPALMRCVQDEFEWAEVDVRLSRDGRHVLWHDSNLDQLGRPGIAVKDLNLEELEALDAGAWFAKRYQGELEFDIHTTRDGQFFLLHDGRLDRTTSGKEPIAEATAEGLAKLDAGAWFGHPFAGLPVPRLDDFLAAVPPGMQLYFDAKAIPPQALAAAIEKYGLVERTIVYQSADYLLELKAINPRIRALPPLGSPEQIDGLAAKLQPYAVDARWSILSKEVIDRLHAHGIKVFSDALSANEQIARYQQALGWGIDLIQTDYPLRVYRAMELQAQAMPMK